ncbi:MAG: PepSY-associated TM helix domain-containing protein [Bacilli bacterium]
MKKSFYQTVWRWHFFAGIIFGPILIMLAITGAIYLFKPYVDPMLNQELHYVDEGATPKSYSLMMSSVQKYSGDSTISNFTSPLDADRSAQFSVEGEKTGTVYVDPYTAKVLGFKESSNQFMDLVVALHGELLIGTTGDRMVELAASWAVLLLISGFYLYWPTIRNIKALFKWPQKSDKRSWWRTTHALVGFWGSLGILLLVLTGLPWAGVAGEQISKIATATHSGYPDGLFSDPPSSVIPTKDVAKTAWAAENVPVPKSTQQSPSSLTIDEIVTIIQNKKVAPGYTLTLPKEKTGVFTAAIFPTDVKKQATLHIDQYSGKVLVDLRFQDYGFLAKVIETGIALHEGRLLGPVNLIICLLLCTSLVFIVISGIVMWWKRRPTGTLGVPVRSEGRNPILWYFILLLLGILMPLAGITMIIALLLDFLILRRFSIFN